jgi:hypothetical protein
LDALKKTNSNYRIYLSKTTDKKKNPLTFEQKVKWVKKLFPEHSKAIQDKSKAVTPIDVLVELYKEGYTEVVMVAGSDRVKGFEELLNKYNGVEARHGFYEFNSIKIVSAGERDPDADDVTGMSASKLRQAVVDGDMESFLKGIPGTISTAEADSYFSDIKRGMGL